VLYRSDQEGDWLELSAVDPIVKTRKPVPLR